MQVKLKYILPSISTLFLSFVKRLWHTVVELRPVSVQSTHPTSRIPTEQPDVLLRVLTVAPFSVLVADARVGDVCIPHQVASKRRSTRFLDVQENEDITITLDVEMVLPLQVLLRKKGPLGLGRIEHRRWVGEDLGNGVRRTDALGAEIRKEEDARDEDAEHQSDETFETATFEHLAGVAVDVLRTNES